MKNDQSISILVFNNFTNDSRVLKEANSLAKNGFKVTVVAHHDPKTIENETTSLFKIVRVSFLDRKKAGIITKTLAYIKYIKQSIKLVRHSDYLHCNDLNTLPISFIIKTFFNNNIKVIYDAHEYETETNGLKGLKKILTKVGEKILIRHTNKTITVSESIAKAYDENYPKNGKPSLVLNCPPFQELKKQDLFRQAFDISQDSTIFLYQGGLSKGRGIETILNAFKQSKNPKNVIVFMGYGDLQKEIEDVTKNNSNIFLHDAVSPSVLIDYTSSADFGISTIENTCLSYNFCLPNKLFEYIMAEIPVIVSNLPEMKKIVLENKIGFVMKNNTPESLLKTIEEAAKAEYNDLRKNISTIKSTYNWETQEEVLLKTYKSLI